MKWKVSKQKNFYKNIKWSKREKEREWERERYKDLQNKEKKQNNYFEFKITYIEWSCKAASKGLIAK